MTGIAPPAVTRVHRVHAGRFADALDRFRTLFDQGLSLTDCTNLAVMEDEGVLELATFDGGFEGLVQVVDG